MAFGQVNKIVNYTWKFTDADKAQQAMANIQRAAGVAIVAIAGAMTALTVSSVNVAGAFREVENQFAVTFGDAAPRARAELDAFAESVGRSGDRMLESTAAFQAFLVPMGVLRDDAADMSVTAIKLATDLGSFWNADTAQVAQDMQSAFAGMSRPMRKYGIDVSDAATSAELLRMGIEGGTQAATNAEKALARLNIMVNQSGDAIGDTARTSDEWENQLRTVEDAWYDVRLEIGEEVIPIIQDLIPEVLTLMGDFKEFAVEAIPAVIENLKDLAPTIFEIMGLMVQFGNVITIVAEGWQKLTRDSTAELRTFAAGMNAELESAMNWESILESAEEAGRSLRDSRAGSLENSIFGETEVASIFNTIAEIDEEISNIGSGDGEEPPFAKHIREMKENIKEATDAYADQIAVLNDLRMSGIDERRTALDEIAQSEMERAQQTNDLLVRGAADFGRELRNGGQDMLGLAVKIALEFAKIQLGKSLGLAGNIGFSFLGGFF